MLTRDQERARRAYEAIGGVPEGEREDYKIAVHALGAEILESGLAAAMSGLERRKEKGDLLRGHLAAAGIPKLIQAGTNEPILSEPVSATNLPDKIRALDTDAYILATRETLQIVLWLKRAVQAKFEGA